MSVIAGKTIAITGAARGIGLATATELAARGARVVIGDRDPRALREALAQTPPAITGHPVDVTDATSFAAFLQAAGPIEVLVNNAGVMPVGHFLEQTDAVIDNAIAVNFTSVLTGCRLALPQMIARGGGHIVNIASLAGVVPVPGEVVYAGTKAAVIALSTALADEFAPHGVQVSVVLPPFTATELIAGIDSPAGSRPVTPEAIARAVAQVLIRPKTHVVVPYSMRFMGPLMSLMGPRSRRLLNRMVGSDRAFLEFDAAARDHYRRRVESASDDSGDQ